MKLAKMKKEDLELLSHKDITYYILEEEGKMNTADLFKRVVTLLELPNKTFEEKIGDYYTLLTTDKRFIMLEDGYWDLKEFHNPKVIVDDEEDDIITSEDLEEQVDELEEEPDDDDIFYDTEADDDLPDDDLEDLVVIDVDDEEANS